MSYDSTASMENLVVSGSGERDRKSADGNGGDSSPLKPLRNLKVLLIDDSQDTLEMYERFLKDQGATVVTASDGVTALQTLLFLKPDVTILDLAMPRITGWEVLQTLRRDARTRRLCVIALSGQDARDSAMAAGADFYVAKPCLPHHLMSTMLRVLSQCARR